MKAKTYVLWVWSRQRYLGVHGWTARTNDCAKTSIYRSFFSSVSHLSWPTYNFKSQSETSPLICPFPPLSCNKKNEQSPLYAVLYTSFTLWVIRCQWSCWVPRAVSGFELNSPLCKFYWPKPTEEASCWSNYHPSFPLLTTGTET